MGIDQNKLKACIIYNGFENNLNNLSYISKWFDAIICKTKEQFKMVRNEVETLVIYAEGDNKFEFIKNLRKDLGNPIIPLIVISDEDSTLIKESADYVAKREEINDPIFVNRMLGKIEKIKENLKLFTPLDKRQTQKDRDMIFVLRFLLSRNRKKIKPVAYGKSKMGYVYPFVETIVKGEVSIILAEMERDGLLSGKFIDRIHLCPFCSSSHLNFREVCPKCKSPNLTIEETIHHYYCGYLGPISDFKVKGEDGLICPKCHRKLRHIGVDYDKPSEIFICNECGNKFTEPEIDCLCLDCGRIFPAEDTRLFDVKEFQITDYGNEVAHMGRITSIYFKELVINSFGSVSFEFFKKLVEHEIKRMKRYKINSSILHIKILNMDEVEKEEGGQKTFKLMKDFVNILHEELRETDIVSAKDRKNIYVLLPETPVKRTEKIIERLRKKVDSLLIPIKIPLKLELYALNLEERGKWTLS